MSSRAVTIGALSALSLTVAACASPAPQRTTLTYPDKTSQSRPNRDSIVLVPDEVIAHCVVRASKNGSGYQVVHDDLCAGAGKRSTYMWYYGGTRKNGRVLKGVTIRPKHAVVRTATGDPVLIDGRINRPKEVRVNNGSGNSSVSGGGSGGSHVSRGGFGTSGGGSHGVSSGSRSGGGS